MVRRRPGGALASSRGTILSTRISFSVMVPVLSTQSTSTRARVSIQLSSCTRVWRRARRMTPTARATLGSR